MSHLQKLGFCFARKSHILEQAGFGGIDFTGEIRNQLNLNIMSIGHSKHCVVNLNGSCLRFPNYTNR